MSMRVVTDWIVAGGTLVLAAVAIFQETIRGWFYRPTFSVTTSTEPPHCVSVPVANALGPLGDLIYLRVWIENTGNAEARNVEVYASELRRLRAVGSWERVEAFPIMNLRWANAGGTMYWPIIVPGMGKHCDVAHITDPARRAALREDSPKLSLGADKASMAFDLIAAPNHKGHIVGPGQYQLDILVAAENAMPVMKTLQISLDGKWDPDEATMLRDHVGIRVI